MSIKQNENWIFAGNYIRHGLSLACVLEIGLRFCSYGKKRNFHPCWI